VGMAEALAPHCRSLATWKRVGRLTQALSVMDRIAAADARVMDGRSFM
jgi:hypothetical protein